MLLFFECPWRSTYNITFKSQGVRVEVRVRVGLKVWASVPCMNYRLSFACKSTLTSSIACQQSANIPNTHHETRAQYLAAIKVSRKSGCHARRSAGGATHIIMVRDTVVASGEFSNSHLNTIYHIYRISINKYSPLCPCRNWRSSASNSPPRERARAWGPHTVECAEYQSPRKSIISRCMESN